MKSPRWAEGRILVHPRAGLPQTQLDGILNRLGGQVIGRIQQIGVRLVSVPAVAEEAVIQALSRNPHIQFAEKDMLLELSGTSNDPNYSKQWHLPKIQASDAWTTSQGTGITVAILDTGVDSSHPDLVDRMVSGWNSVDGSTDTADIHGHGTSVSGTTAATTNNGTGVASVAGVAQIMPIRVTNSSDGYAYFSDIARGLTWAADNGARVANISYNVSSSSSISNAAKYMTDKGGMVVVAAGNDGKDPGYSDNPYMISVSATSNSDTKTSWSNYGYYIDVAAPGAGIYTTKKGGSYGSVSGTSFSSPATAGVVALIMATNPDLSPADVESILESTADDLGDSGWDTYYGYGRVNAAAAVKAAAGGEDQDTEAPSVAITSPGGGTKVSGIIPVDVSVSDNVGVARVELHVDGTLVATDTTEPFGFSWDTTGVADGSVALVAYAFDAADNQGISKTVEVTVDNVADESTGEVIVDNKDGNTTQTGTWKKSSGSNPWAGESVYNNSGSTFRWIPEVAEAGSYQVYAWWTHHSNRSDNVPYRIKHSAGTDTVFVNQKDSGLGGQWVLLGTYDFASGNGGYVEISSENGQASADAVRLVKAGTQSKETGTETETVVDNNDGNTTQTGTWKKSSGSNPWAGGSVYSNSGSTFRWIPEVAEAGSYQVYAWWTYHSNRSDNVPYRIKHSGGTDTVFVNQRDSGLGGQWILLGTYDFASGSGGYVEVSSENGQASADAVRLVR